MILGRVTSDAEDVPKTMSVGVGKGAGASSSQQATVLISAPKKEELDPEEELIEDSEARFQISERAAEVCVRLLLSPVLCTALFLRYLRGSHADCKSVSFHL